MEDPCSFAHITSPQHTEAREDLSSSHIISPQQVMYFATSPICPSIQRVEDLPSWTTPGGHRHLELRSTEAVPLSTGAARKVLKRPGARLLASRASRRRISIVPPPEKLLEEDVRSLKETLESLTTRNANVESRLCRLESLNPDLYEPLHTSRTLAISNMLRALLRTFDQALSTVMGPLQETPSIHALVSAGGPWCKQSVDGLTYSQLWWMVYNQINHDPQVSLENFWRTKLGCDVPSPPVSHRKFPVKKTHVLHDAATLVVVPMLMQPTEIMICQLLDQQMGSIELRDMMGCYISIFLPRRNEGIHMFENLLNLGSKTKPHASAPTRTRLFDINESSDLQRLGVMQAVLTDILDHLGELGELQALRPLIACVAKQLKDRCDRELMKPPGWILTEDREFWMSPDGCYCMQRQTGKAFEYDYDAQAWVLMKDDSS